MLVPHDTGLLCRTQEPTLAPFYPRLRSAMRLSCSRVSGPTASSVKLAIINIDRTELKMYVVFSTLKAMVDSTVFNHGIG